MICASIGEEKSGAPPASSSRMICSRMLRVRSSPLLASTTLKFSLPSTSCLTSASVMYALVCVSYSRRFGYFLINRVAFAIGLSGSTHVQAAVAGELRAGREACVVAGQPADDRCDLLGLAEPAHRDLLDDLLAHVLAHRHHHVGGDVAGCDRVHRDALARHLERQRHREAVHPGFRGGVVRLPELPLLAVHRRDVDDAAPAAVEHAV